MLYVNIIKIYGSDNHVWFGDNRADYHSGIGSHHIRSRKAARGRQRPGQGIKNFKKGIASANEEVEEEEPKKKEIKDEA